jgi:hypothetical protein
MLINLRNLRDLLLQLILNGVRMKMKLQITTLIKVY